MHEFKKTPGTIYKRNSIIDNILSQILSGKRFLILGHHKPDEDCVASMVAISLIVSKFYKEISLYFSKEPHEHFTYLLHICKYNSISIKHMIDINIDNYDQVIVCDTPKESMVDSPCPLDELRHRGAPVIEFDHHIGGDSTFIGDPDLSYVDEASSCCELIGILALKIASREKLLISYDIHQFFTRNLILSLISGIAGDTKMGKYLKSKKEKIYYRLFSSMLNSQLNYQTVRSSNFSSMAEVFNELVSLSKTEEDCYNELLQKQELSGSFSFVVVEDSFIKRYVERCDFDTFVQVTRVVADELAEINGRIGLIVYAETNGSSGVYQFRMRRSQNFRDYDLRNVLADGGFVNGGGHEGAISFRYKKNPGSDLYKEARRVIALTEESIEQRLSLF